MKIGFFYPRYYPVTASASVHGYKIAKELVNRGHTLLSCTNDENPDCVKYPATKMGTCRLMKDADVLYIRLASYFEHVSMWKLVRPLSLPVIWEINAPLEERYAFDDGDKYRQFISTVNPLVVPTKTIGWLVTCRLEKYRELTEKWRKKHGIRYNHLMMMDLPDKDTRIALGTHPDFKAKVYKITNAALFIESSYSQAQEIARRAGKTVFCTETWQIVDQNCLIGSYKRGKELIGKAIINPLKAPFRILSFTKRKLSTLHWKILAELKKNRSTRHL